MTKCPLFIHINNSGGKYTRSKLCERYNENFIVHHINPKLYMDIVPRNKVIRCWKYRDPSLKYNTETEKYNNFCIFNFYDTVPFVILRDPIERYKAENNGIIAPWKDVRSHNIICKSLYVAFTGILSDFFLEFNEDKYNYLLKFLRQISVIRLDKIYELSNIFNFNSPPVYKKEKNYNNDDNNKIIEDVNYFDCKLYNFYN